MVVVVRALESMDRRRDDIIEVIQRPRAPERYRVEQTRIPLELGLRFRTQSSQKVSRVYAREPAFDEPGPALEIERDGDRCRAADLAGRSITALAEPLEQHVAAERKPRQHEWLAGMLTHQPVHDEVQIGRLSRMIESPRPRDLAVAATKDQGVRRPS